MTRPQTTHPKSFCGPRLSRTVPRELCVAGGTNSMMMQTEMAVGWGWWCWCVAHVKHASQRKPMCSNDDKTNRNKRTSNAEKQKNIIQLKVQESVPESSRTKIKTSCKIRKFGSLEATTIFFPCAWPGVDVLARCAEVPCQVL